MIRPVAVRRGRIRRGGLLGDSGANAGADQPTCYGGTHIVPVMVIAVVVITMAVSIVAVAVPIIRLRGWSKRQSGSKCRDGQQLH